MQSATLTIVRDPSLWSGWHRSSSRHHWRLVAQHTDERTCWELLHEIKGGEFYLAAPHTANPNGAKR